MGCGPRDAIKNLNIKTFATFMELVHQISERMEHAVGFHDVAVLLCLDARFALSVRDRQRRTQSCIATQSPFKAY